MPNITGSWGFRPLDIGSFRVVSFCTWAGPQQAINMQVCGAGRRLARGSRALLKTPETNVAPFPCRYGQDLTQAS